MSKIVIEDASEELFFAGKSVWVTDPASALQFRSIIEALQFATKTGVRRAHVVSIDECPAHRFIVPVPGDGRYRS